MRIGIDLGGSKIEALALDAQGRDRSRLRVATPQGDYQATLTAIAGLVQRIEAELGCRGSVGVGTPGSLSQLSGRIKNANSTCLNQQPLQDDLQALLQRPVRLANDANCFALSEAVDGAASDATVVFGVIIGTGVGGGLVINRQLLEGRNRIAGEWGHNPMPAAVTAGQQRRCYCGRHNCVETFLSGPGLALTYQQLSGVVASAEQIAQWAEQGQPLARQALADYQRQLAAALAVVINIVDPDVIVLGGGVSNIASLYQTVPPLWRDSVFNDSVGTRLVAARHGDSSGVRGAAWLWPESP